MNNKHKYSLAIYYFKIFVTNATLLKPTYD